MKLETYAVTPGLEHFPERERFRVYRASHKRLLQENASYRRSYQRRFPMLVAAVILPLGALQTLGQKMGESVIATLLFALLLVGYALLNLYAAVRLQHYMNQHAGDALRISEHA